MHSFEAPDASRHTLVHLEGFLAPIAIVRSTHLRSRVHAGHLTNIFPALGMEATSAPIHTTPYYVFVSFILFFQAHVAPCLLEEAAFADELEFA